MSRPLSDHDVPPIPPKSRLAQENQARKVRQVTSEADRVLLEQAYSFVPSSESKSWQDRMVQHYHSHLYKEFVLADFTSRPGQVGLRWRTQHEVTTGKGSSTCGNKHCPSYATATSTTTTRRQDTQDLQQYLNSSFPKKEEDELKLLSKLDYGVGLEAYEVPFTYQERKETKTELVKLMLCLRCAPLLFRKPDAVNHGCALEARNSRCSGQQGAGAPPDGKECGVDDDKSTDSTIDDSDDEERRRREKLKKRKRKKEKKRRKRIKTD
jgi:protein FRA10AC1